MNIHILQHAPFEDIGAIEEWINKHKHTKSYTKLYESTNFPEIDSFDFLIILGGPMGTYEEEKYPWLCKEKEFILQAANSEKKILGICLGSQLLADVLGAKVYKNKAKEVGWFPVRLTQEGKKSNLFEWIKEEIMVFHWHGDTFKLPGGSVHLMKSEGCENQAYLYKNNILGIQFHFEATPESILSMLKNDSDYLDNSSEFLQNENEILEKLKYSQRSNEILFVVIDRFLEM